MRSITTSAFAFLWRAAAALVLGLGVHALEGQALPYATGPGSYIAAGGGASAFPSDYDGRKIGGGMAFVDLNPYFHYGIEAETRFLRIRTDENVNQTNYLAGPRIAFQTGKIRPYAKFLVGTTRINAPFNYGQGTFFTYAPGGGLDYRYNKRLTIRVLDVEYQIVPAFLGTEVRNFGISVGASYRLTSLHAYPKTKKLH